MNCSGGTTQTGWQFGQHGDGAVSGAGRGRADLAGRPPQGCLTPDPPDATCLFCLRAPAPVLFCAPHEYAGTGGGRHAGFQITRGCAQVEAESTWAARDLPVSVYGALTRARDRLGRPARDFVPVVFRPQAPRQKPIPGRSFTTGSRRPPTCFAALACSEDDTVAYVLPTLNDTAIALLGGMTAGRVNPINPLLEPEKIAAILRETRAKVVVTLRAFPKPMSRRKWPRPWPTPPMSNMCWRWTCCATCHHRKAGSCR